MKNGLYTRIYKKTFVFVVVLLVFGVAFGFASLNFYKIKADTNYYEDIKPYVINDWENYTNYNAGGVYLTNNGDGTLQCYGTASSIVDIVLPLTQTTTQGGYYYAYYIACALNNTLNVSFNTNLRFYIAYNNGANILNYYAYCGQGTGSQNTVSMGARTGLCLVARFSQGFDVPQGSAITITPFLYLKETGTTPTYTNMASLMSVYSINSTLGPDPTNIDLTKVNYIQEASNISLTISSQINKSFGNELEELMQYTMQAGDEITVNNTGVATTEIDLLIMTAGLDTYKMTFINDNLSNDYLNIYLYKNNDATIFYNNNLGELSAQNIYDFRVWATMAINGNATITSASANNNDILSKLFVYSTGTNYETGYTAGYNDARQGVEEEIQEAWGDGLEQGYQDGYTTGYGEGYDQGAIEGVDSSWLINLFGTIDTFFSIHLFPNLTIGTLFAIPFVLSIAWVIIRILRGGGYGD